MSLRQQSVDLKPAWMTKFVVQDEQRLSSSAGIHLHLRTRQTLLSFGPSATGFPNRHGCSCFTLFNNVDRHCVRINRENQPTARKRLRG